MHLGATMPGMQHRSATPAPAPAPAGADLVADVGGFLLGVGLAWRLGWRVGDLIWNLWLSSLVIGYATIVLGIVRARGASLGATGAASLMAGKLFLLLFFTVHFGLFHVVHSVFLGLFFPVGGRSGFLPDYGAVVTNGWPWLFVAAIAERRALWPRGPQPAEFSPFAPYTNVVRMHLLIFFFVGAMLAGLDGPLVYAVVYAVYFWPWRRQASPRTAPVPERTTSA